MSATNTASPKLIVAIEDGIKTITINRPERLNALDNETFDLLLEAITQSATDDSKVIILTGSGEAFSAGADLQTNVSSDDIMAGDVTESLRRRINPAILAIRNIPKPFIARVHGAAAGVGCNYVLACDLIVASEHARFGQVFVKIALMPDGGGTYFLPRSVGYHKAFELMALGELISAADALALGLVNHVVPFDSLDSTVGAIAKRLAASPSIALAKIKHGLNAGMQTDLATALDFEAVNQGDCFRTADFAEGVKAFLEKRRPVFQGK